MKDKIKRGIEITLKESGKLAWVERDRQDGTLLLRDTQLESPQTIYFDESVHNICLSRKGLKTAKIQPKNKTKEKLTYDQQLTEFFRKMSLRMPNVCDECGSKLMAFNNFGKRCCTSHIFPKAQFKSISMDENNIMFLGADITGGCSCHDEWDRLGAEHRKKMKVYQTALEALKALKSKMTNKELVMVYTYLGLEWQ